MCCKGQRQNIGEANNWDSMVTKFSAVVNTYKNPFCGMRGNTGSVTSTLPVDFTQEPNQPFGQVGRPESKRKEPLVKTQQNKCNKKAKAVDQKCGFCGSPEHGRQTVCPLMHILGQKITDKKDFINFLFSIAPLLLSMARRRDPASINATTRKAHCCAQDVLHINHASRRAGTTAVCAYSLPSNSSWRSRLAYASL